jgi:lantibiotic modifying enzyme
MSASLHGGFAGVGWMYSHLFGSRKTADGAEDVDEAVLDALGSTDDYDLIGGLAGLAVYSLERLPRKSAIESLRRIVKRLDEMSETIGTGITWHTPPDRLPAWQRALCPNGYYNLGLAHGVPGVIGVLARISAAGVQRVKARRLLRGGVLWLLGQRRLERSSRFVAWVGPGTDREDCRSAWCYGDPGAAAALLMAARCVGEPRWEKEAIAIALAAAIRPPGDSGVTDAGICHGAAGLGHVFNRMYQTTGHEDLKRAAVFWFERTLEMRKRPSARGTVAGFSTIGADRKGNPRHWADPGFLTGAAGIAMALLAAATPFEPAWDRTLLLSHR